MTETKAAPPAKKTMGPDEFDAAVARARTPAQLLRAYSPDDVQDFRACMHGYPGGSSKIPDPDVAMFAWRCKVTGLDPFQGHIVAIFRKDEQAEGGVKMSMQVEVAGLRVAAFRSGELVSISEPEFDREPGIDDQPPKWARVVVKRRGPTGNEMEFAYTAYYREFVRNGPVWKSSPIHMLSLRAEGHALKKAFPDILAGLDLGGAGDDDGDRPVMQREPEVRPVTKAPIGEDRPAPRRPTIPDPQPPAPAGAAR